MPDVIAVSREELYTLVWSEPVRTVAKRFGISDVGLAKRCRRLGIPLPGLGYWARKAAGKRVRQQPLPPLPIGATEATDALSFTPRAENEEAVQQTGPAAEQEAFEALPENRIVVPDELRSPHPFVRRTRDAFRGRATRADEFVGNWQEPHLDVHVTRACLPRALRIMSALVKAFERRGWKVTLGLGRERQKSCVVVLGQSIPFGIRERIKKVENEPAKPVRSYDGTWHTPFQTKYRDVPSGKLSLVIRARWEGSTAVETSWDETTRHPLEECLNEFAVAIVAKAEYWREWERQRVESEQRRQEEERRRWVEEQRRQREAAQLRELEQEAADWQRSQRIRDYVAAIRDAAGSVALSEELTAWLHWGEERAAQLDPIPNRLAADEDHHVELGVSLDAFEDE